MKKESLTFGPWSELHDKWMKDPEYQKEYEALKPEYEFLEAIIKQRIKKGLTQKQLAERIGKQQSAIARFEAGTYSPTLRATREVTDNLGLELILREKKR